MPATAPWAIPAETGQSSQLCCCCCCCRACPLPPPLLIQGDTPKLSRKQRQLIARVQHAKAQREKSGSITSGSSFAADAASDAASSDTQLQGDQQQPRQLSTASLATAATASSTDLTAIVEPARNSLEVTSPKTASKYGKASSCCSSAGSFTTAAAAKDDGDSANASPGRGSKIHACVVLDPIYNEGRIVGYLAERSFLCPRGESGAVKLVLRDVLGLLKVEGRQVLNLGLAVAHEVKSGEFEFKFKSVGINL